MTFFGLVRKNLFRKPLRTALTAFAIAIAFLIFGVLGALRGALNSGADLAAADRLITTHKINFTLSLPSAYVERVKAIEGVKRVAFADWFGGYFQEQRNFVVAIAVDPENFLDIYPEYLLTAEERAAFLGDRTALIVGKQLAERFGWKVGDRVPLNSNIYDNRNGTRSWDFVVAGIFQPRDAQTDTNAVYFHHEYFDESRTFGTDSIGWMIVQTTDPAVNERVIAAIDAQFANSPFETSTKTEQQFNAAFAAQLGDIGFIVLAVSGAAFFTILLIVGNSMMLAIRERTGEIAVLKTIGFTARRVFGLVLSESMLLACVGGLLGLGLAFAAVQGLSGFLSSAFPPLIMSPDIIGAGIAIMLGLGLITGLLPALRAMNTDVITALRR